MIGRKIIKQLASYSSRYYSNSATKVVQENGVRTITLSNPKTRNALSLSTMKEIITHMTEDSENSDLRCVVLRAEGPVFSSGHNLKEFNGNDGREVFSTATQLMSSVISCPLPVIAAVDGLAAAAGCQLVAQCDIAICTPTSTFSTPGANFGLFCSTPGVAAARSVGRKVALRMLLTGLPITADEAYQSGLVSKVVAAHLLDEELKVITDAICAKSKPVISLGKKFFYQQVERDLHTAYKMGEDVMTHNLSLKDGQEGIRSFIEKRKPVWSHSNDS